MNSLQIPGFEILELARETSSTLTWKALQRSLDRVVFIRAIKPESTELQREAFESVAKAVARLKHPNLIQAFDVGRDESGSPYIVLEAAEGTHLAELLAQERQMGAVRVARIGANIADALDTAWKQSSLIHRNLKPENFCVTAEGSVKLIEFGTATLIQAGIDPLHHDGGMIVGTPNYMAPEQARGSHDLDFHADMYGLGTLLYHLLTGVAPFAFETDPAKVLELQITGMLPSPRVANPKIPGTMETVLGRLLMKDPHHRYDWWQDVVADLHRVSHGRSVSNGKELPAGADATLIPFAANRRIPPRTAAPAIRPVRGSTTNRPSGTGPAATGGSTATATNRRAPEPSLSPPAPVRTCLWLLLAAALSVLAAYRWKNPQLASFPGLQPASPGAEPYAHSRAPSGEALARSDASPAETRQTPVPSVQPRPSSPGSLPPAVSTQMPAASELPQELTDYVTQALAQGDLAVAREQLTQSAGRVGGAEPLRSAALRALAAAGDPNDVVAALLLDRSKGKPVSLTYRGRSVTVIPESYAAGHLLVQLVGADGSNRPWSIPLAALDAGERLRLIGPNPAATTPPDASSDTALALLAIAAGDRGLAHSMAARIPALAPFLNHVVNR